MSTPVSSASWQVFAPSVPYKTRPALFSHQRHWPTVKVQQSSTLKAVKVVQVGHKWQSNHYKVRTDCGSGGGGTQEKKSWFLLWQTGSLALSEGDPARGQHFGSLISVRVSEAMKCGGKPKPWGGAQMVERSQDCKQSSTLKGVRWLFHLH